NRRYENRWQGASGVSRHLLWPLAGGRRDRDRERLRVPRESDSGAAWQVHLLRYHVGAHLVGRYERDGGGRRWRSEDHGRDARREDRLERQRVPANGSDQRGRVSCARRQSGTPARRGASPWGQVGYPARDGLRGRAVRDDEE